MGALRVSGDDYNGPSLTVAADSDGYPAYVDAAHVRVYGVDGFTMEVSAWEAGMDQRRLYESIRIHSGAGHDPSTWGPPIAS